MHVFADVYRQCFTTAHIVCFNFVFSGVMSVVQSRSLDGVFQICSPDPVQDENHDVNDILLSMTA